MSVIRDPETYEQYEHVILAHGVRVISELGYFDYIRNDLPKDEYLGEQVKNQLLYYPTVTRESFPNQGRLTDLLDSGKLTSDLGLPPLNPEFDRVMICGNQGMLDELVVMLKARAFREGKSHEQGHYTIERAFVEKD